MVRSMSSSVLPIFSVRHVLLLSKISIRYRAQTGLQIRYINILLLSMDLEKYRIIKRVGSGGFGTVWQAVNKHTGEVVAVKMLRDKFYSWEECLNLPEIKVVSKVMKHANIVKLKEVIKQDDILYLVFEYMEGNLYDLMKNKGEPFSEAEVKKWCFQVFQGLAYVHQCGFIHRDIKPDNLLLSKDNDVKIADFGLALEVNSESPRDDYVGTHYYRAPEILLHSANYGRAVDMWAMGATMAELLGFHPLFPGSSEADQLYRICRIIGSPKEGEWDDGLELARVMNYKFPQTAGVNLSMMIPSASEDAIDLIKSLCSWDPSKRPTATEVLRHRFFRRCLSVPPFLRPKAAPSATTCAPMGKRFGYGCSGDLPNLYAGVQRKAKKNPQNEQIYLMRSVMQQPRSLLAGMNGSIANQIGSF